MKKLFIYLFLLTVFTATCYGEEKNCSFVGFSVGHTWFHEYSGFSKSGMNLSLYYEPAITKHFNIDNSLSLHLYWNDAGPETLFETGNKNYYFAPQFLIGPRGTVSFFDKLSVFFGGGLGFAVGIRYLTEQNETRASFSPGFYLRTGLDFAPVRFFTIGLEVKYSWSAVQVPYMLSFNIRLSYRHKSRDK